MTKIKKSIEQRLDEAIEMNQMASDELVALEMVGETYWKLYRVRRAMEGSLIRRTRSRNNHPSWWAETYQIAEHQIERSFEAVAQAADIIESVP